MPDDPNTATGGSEAERTLVVDRLFRASPERVFRAWTDPALLVQWWGPEGFTVPEHDLDIRPGGAWRTVMRSPKGTSHTVSGVYREIVPSRRLVMTWAWQQDDGTRGHETEIAIDFAAAPEGTRIHLVQKLFRGTADRDSHNAGWTSTFNDLDRLLAG
jgi:uncharacterized protein YndB with AHSA1/START domain